MFWLVLLIGGSIVDSWGPSSRDECEAKRVVMAIGKPAGQAYMCVRR